MSATPESDLRSLRILIQCDGTLRRLCKLGFSQRDASLYVVPYGPLGRYRFGVESFASVERKVEIDTELHGALSGLPPHLSIHESGRVHIRSAGSTAGPLQVPPLLAWAGQHAATVSPVSFTGLAPFSKTPKQTGGERDFVFGVDTSNVQSGRLAIYLNGAEPKFATQCPMRFTLARPGLAAPLQIGLAPLSNEPLGPGAGVTVIGGWDPTVASTAPASFLYVNAR